MEWGRGLLSNIGENGVVIGTRDPGVSLGKLTNGQVVGCVLWVHTTAGGNNGNRLKWSSGKLLE